MIRAQHPCGGCLERSADCRFECQQWKEYLIARDKRYAEQEKSRDAAEYFQIKSNRNRQKNAAFRRKLSGGYKL